MINNISNNFDVRYGLGYNDYMCLYYSLAELVDEETLRKYQFTSDIQVLIDGVSNYGNINQEEIKNFIDNLNNSRKYDKETHLFELAGKNDMKNVVKECYYNLNYYFNEKFGYDIEDNLKVSVLYYDKPSYSLEDNYRPYSVFIDVIFEDLMLECVQSKLGEEAIINCECISVTPRTYLSKNHLNPIISFIHPSTVSVEIDDTVSIEFASRIKKSDKVLVITN